MKNKKREYTTEELRIMEAYKVYRQHHRKPQTRREFLASGLMSGAAAVMAPSILNVLSRSGFAEAAECATNATKLPGYINLNLNGGASLAGNFIVTDKGGNLLSSYQRVGLGTAGAVQGIMQKEFGESGPAFASISGFLGGLINATSADTRANTACLGLACESQDDTSNNELDTSGMMSKVVSGGFLPALNANRNNPAIVTAPASLSVNSVNDLQGAIGVSGLANLSRNDKGKVFRMISNLSASQGRKLASEGGKTFRQLVEEATGKNINLVGSEDNGIDPQTDTSIADAAIWNFNNNADSRDAAVVYNALNGNASMANLQRGGYDYHGQGRANQDTRDTQAGMLVGKILETARVMETDVVVSVTSDGSVSHTASAVPGAAPSNDQGEHGMAYMFFYSPLGRAQQTAGMVGHFEASGNRMTAASNTAIGGTEARLAAGIVLNYMAFSGQSGAFGSVAPGTFTPTQMDEVIKISRG